MTLLAFIPLLCPWDDIVLGIIIALFPTCALALWVKKRFKWCKKPCGCKCHDQKNIGFKPRHPKF